MGMPYILLAPVHGLGGRIAAVGEIIWPEKREAWGDQKKNLAAAEIAGRLIEFDIDSGNPLARPATEYEAVSKWMSAVKFDSRAFTHDTDFLLRIWVTVRHDMQLKQTLKVNFSRLKDYRAGPEFYINKMVKEFRRKAREELVNWFRSGCPAPSSSIPEG